VSTLVAHLPVLQVLVPLGTAPLVMLLRPRGLAWMAATAASLCAFGVAIGITDEVRQLGSIGYHVGGWPAPYGIEISVDAFSALLLLILTGASSVALLMARGSVDAEVPEGRQHLFYTAWLLALAGFSGILVSGDAFNIFVFMEISSLATYVLISGGARRQALPAVFRYLVLGTIGATFYLIGVGLIYMMTGTLNLADMEARVRGVRELNPVLVAGAFTTVGLALKAAIFPLHAWLPNAYTYAPHVVTAFLAASSTKVALYVLFRFDFVVFHGNFPEQAVQISAFVLPLAVAAILVASAMAIAERNLKRLLAYSSVAQIGYIVLGAGMASSTALTGGIAHMFNHALAKGGLFLAIACLATRIGDLTVGGLAGAGRQMPLTMAGLVAAGLSLIGIPGTAGFVGKWYLVVAAVDLGLWGLLLALPILVGSLMAVVYVWRLVEAAYFATPVAPSGAGEAPGWMVLVLWGIVVLNVYFGLQPGLPLELASEAAVGLLGRER
jgi:multicomponent Na+:H+ antiporter subunit D